MCNFATELSLVYSSLFGVHSVRERCVDNIFDSHIQRLKKKVIWFSYFEKYGNDLDPA